MPSSMTYASRTAHVHGIEQFSELYTYLVDRHNFYSAARVFHCSTLLELSYDVWRFLSTGLHPSEDHIETWAIVNSDNQDTF
jgi:hypothetical protein